MDEIRFERRAFARTFGIVKRRLHDLGRPIEIPKRAETYLISATVNRDNIKCRGGALEIKSLLGCMEDLEQWAPVWRECFPISSRALRTTVLPRLHVPDLALPRSDYDLEQLIGEIIDSRPELVVARVRKQRTLFVLDAVRAEHALVEVNGAGVETIAAESADPGQLRDFASFLGLDGYENVSYVRAIQHIVCGTPSGGIYRWLTAGRETGAPDPAEVAGRSALSG